MRQRLRAMALSSNVLIALVAGAAAGAGAEGGGARSVPTFSSTVDLVNLNVSVSDGHDHYVAGLGAGDFTVFEDGVPQQLCLFTQERLPISLAILIDSSLSMHSSLPAVKTAALRLVHVLRPEDQAEIVQFNHRFNVLQDFTSDPARLETAVNGIQAEGATSVYNALYFTLKEPRFRRRSDQLTRQAIVILSDGEDTSSLVSDDQVLDLARKGDVTIFAICLRQPRPSTLDTDASDRAAFFLSTLARETGGRAYFPTALAQIDGVYDRIADDLRTQYALGYVSSNTAHDGKWRRIAIQTTHAHVMLRHREGYYAGALRILRSALAAAHPAASAATAVSALHPPEQAP